MSIRDSSSAMQVPMHQLASNIVTYASESNASAVASRSPPISPRPSISEQMNLPSWLNERNPSIRSRASRASSIMSTRTGISVNTLQDLALQDDARSIDLHLGEHAFRISRDGSRVTDHQYLPPYSTSPLPYVREESSEVVAFQPTSTPAVTLLYPNRSVSTIDNQESNSGGPPTPTSAKDQKFGQDTNEISENWPSSSAKHRRQESPPVSAHTLASQDLNRNPSFTQGPEQISVDKRRTVSEGDVLTATRGPNEVSQPDLSLERRNAIRLPKLTIDPSYTGDGRRKAGVGEPQEDFEGARTRETQSAGPILKTPSHDRRESIGQDAPPSSPTFIGRQAPGVFPTPPKILISRQQGSATGESEPSTPTASGYTLPSPAVIEEGYAETHMPPPMDNENDISIHYARMIRSIDRDYRKALHSRDTEMADLREKLHEKDTIYRQELRARDFQIEDLKARLEHSEEKQQQMIEKARNEVEDLWETRWKDRGHHLLERMRRMEADSQKLVEQAVAERDREWATDWALKQRHLVDRLRLAEGRTQE